jgi:hypothetical protein
LRGRHSPKKYDFERQNSETYRECLVVTARFRTQQSWLTVSVDLNSERDLVFAAVACVTEMKKGEISKPFDF